MDKFVLEFIRLFYEKYDGGYLTFKPWTVNWNGTQENVSVGLHRFIAWSGNRHTNLQDLIIEKVAGVIFICSADDEDPTEVCEKFLFDFMRVKRVSSPLLLFPIFFIYVDERTSAAEGLDISPLETRFDYFSAVSVFHSNWKELLISSLVRRIFVALYGESKRLSFISNNIVHFKSVDSSMSLDFPSISFLRRNIDLNEVHQSFQICILNNLQEKDVFCSITASFEKNLTNLNGALYMTIDHDSFPVSVCSIQEVLCMNNFYYRYDRIMECSDVFVLIYDLNSSDGFEQLLQYISFIYVSNTRRKDPLKFSLQSHF